MQWKTKGRRYEGPTQERYNRRNCALTREAILSFSNVYDDRERAEAYATLKFPGTYYLAYRDLPAIIAKYVPGREALDFGCGAGRSTRFLKNLGFSVIGIDISSSMIQLAKNVDPSGSYRLVADGDFSAFEPARFDHQFKPPGEHGRLVDETQFIAEGICAVKTAFTPRLGFDGTEDRAVRSSAYL